MLKSAIKANEQFADYGKVSFFCSIPIVIKATNEIRDSRSGEAISSSLSELRKNFACNPFPKLLGLNLSTLKYQIIQSRLTNQRRIGSGRFCRTLGSAEGSLFVVIETTKGIAGVFYVKSITYINTIKPYIAIKIHGPYTMVAFILEYL